ncbi:hypothetical protein PPMP20_30165 [Paraburkholderia phymatum]|uniref:Uncharacterized protein n=1 Tax=Paraburkholderia phymatum (strain DSM 17167 / CIP 108236 / LMG 21445 / STM815) TaxID=391038 RepID=B2JME4_PARP8|nr:hypothetical protein [Paraburkholderia phymatum]ACC74279.1 hypothetical protein Bphy_5196 [Paraburkholderia phymatum STM815]
MPLKLLKPITDARRKRRVPGRWARRMEAAHRQMANMQKVGAMVRAIRRGGMSDADLAAMASTMEQLAVHCEAAAQDHVEAMRLAAQVFGRQQEAGEDETSGAFLRWLRL